MQFVTKRVLHIDSNQRYSRQPKDLEKRGKETISQTYLEEEPTIGQWSRQLIPTRQGAARYVRSLFPSATWIPRYNLHWLLGDAIAGECLYLSFVAVNSNLLKVLLLALSLFHRRWHTPSLLD
jgi:sodium-independent sulfate anion transporter 11